MLINVALTLNAFSQLVGNAGGMGINFCSARIRFPSTFFYPCCISHMSLWNLGPSNRIRGNCKQREVYKYFFIFQFSNTNIRRKVFPLSQTATTTTSTTPTCYSTRLK